MISSFLLVLFATTLIVQCDSRKWSPRYISALLDVRQCYYDRRHIALFDSLIAPLNDTKLIDHHRAIIMSTLSDELNSHKPFCVAVTETGSSLYREMLWHRKQEHRRMSSQKIVPVHHPEREAAINHLVQILSGGEVLRACEAIPSPDMEALIECTRNKRKDSMSAYTVFTE